MTRRHDWSQYEESPGRGRAHWLVWKRLNDTWAIEMYLTWAGGEPQPAEVKLVNYGPRGGTYEVAGGTIESMNKEISTLLDLIEAAQEIEALR